MLQKLCSFKLEELLKYLAQILKLDIFVMEWLHSTTGCFKKLCSFKLEELLKYLAQVLKLDIFVME